MFLDEFQVNDIADAVILSELFNILYKRKIIIVFYLIYYLLYLNILIY